MYVLKIHVLARDQCKTHIKKKKSPNYVLLKNKTQHICPTKSFKNRSFLKSSLALTLNLRLHDKMHTFLDMIHRNP